MKTKTIEEIEMSKRIGKVYNYSVDLCEKISENDQFARVVTSRYLTNIQNSNQEEQTYLESIFRKYSSLIKVPKAFKMIDDMPDIKEEEAKPKKR